jgi:hypothetical protein
MMVKRGAHRNVFAYNVSVSPKASSGRIDEPEGCGNPTGKLADISIHGHYPHHNLFEGNVVNWIRIDNVWGRSGPGNTFIRNNIRGARGFQIDPGNNGQILLGNVIDFALNYDTSRTTILQYGNLISSETDQVIENIPQSLYYSSIPYYYTAADWPAIDTEKNTVREIPALIRNSEDKVFDKKCCGNIGGLNSDIYFAENVIMFFENGSLIIESTNNMLIDVELIDLEGKIHFKLNNAETNSPIFLGDKLNPAFYILHISGPEFDSFYKVVFK